MVVTDLRQDERTLGRPCGKPYGRGHEPRTAGEATWLLTSTAAELRGSTSTATSALVRVDRGRGALAVARREDDGRGTANDGAAGEHPRYQRHPVLVSVGVWPPPAPEPAPAPKKHAPAASPAETVAAAG